MKESIASSTDPNIELVYGEPELEMLDEGKHMNNQELVREINRLRKEINQLKK